MTLRVAILCNDRICLPAVNWLIQSGLTVAVGMPAPEHEIHAVIRLQCKQHNIPFRTFEKAELEECMQDWLLQCQPDVVLVKTFPWLIPSGVLSIPPKGFINFHYAPLPGFRGPSPLFWMVRNEIRDGGVSVHQMDECFDTGPLILQQPLSISPDFTCGLLVSQLAFLGLQLCWALVQALGTGHALPQVHQEGYSKWYRRPLPQDLVVNWERMPAREIRALCLACNPWNKGAATSWNNWQFGLTDVTLLNDHNIHVQTQLPGTVLHADAQNGLLVSCLHNQLLKIDIIYCEEGFFPGHQLASFGIKPGDRLGNYTSMPSPVSSSPETHSTSTLYQS